MAITERSVKNKRNSSGELTGRAGTVYDVNIKYKSEGKSKTYSRKGFPTRKGAVQHEADMNGWSGMALPIFVQAPMPAIKAI